MTSNCTRLASACLATAVALVALGLQPATVSAQLPLNPLTLTKYMDALPIPGPMPRAGTNYYEIGMWEVTQQLHSQLPPTTVWGYGTSQATASYPAATIEAQCNVPIRIKWTNNLPEEHLLDYAIDPTLHMAMWEEGVPAVVHVHGSEVEPESDGGPDAWFTQGFAEKGPGWKKENYTYSNDQLPATIWYHDHVLGLTRLNVYAGLAGFYLLRDPSVEGSLNLPSGAYEIPLVIQDKMFFDDGQLMYSVGGDNPEIHPTWVPEMFGNVILANGKVWPYLDVEPRKYRFRMLNGSNARFYALKLYNDATGMPGPGFWQIGSDGGYLDNPVLIANPADPNSNRLVMSPGERFDVVIDFSAYAPGTTFTMRNNAKAPYPNGETADPQTVGQIMQFRVVPLTGTDTSAIRTPGSGYVERLANATNVRNMTLDEVMGPNGPIEMLLNKMRWDDPVSELPTLGATEVWRITNTTVDAHPMHLHLTQFQLVSRQKINLKKYMRVHMNNTGMPPDPTPYLQGKPVKPTPDEAGWKDTVKAYPGEVTTIIVRFAPQDGGHAYDFDATAEPGYVWHCHIVDHEDNEMMRPYKLQAPLLATKAATSEPTDNVERVDTFGLQVTPSWGVGGAQVALRLPEPGQVSLRVYGVDGRLVRELANRSYEAGAHTIAWDGNDGRGQRVPSGVYFVRAETGSKRLSSRVLIAR